MQINKYLDFNESSVNVRVSALTAQISSKRAVTLFYLYQKIETKWNLIGTYRKEATLIDVIRKLKLANRLRKIKIYYQIIYPDGNQLDFY